MTPLRSLSAPKRYAPRLVEAVGLIQPQIQAERERREQFHAETVGSAS